MKFKKLVFYDLKSEPIEKEYLVKLKRVADKVVSVYAESLKPKHLRGADALVLRLFNDFDDRLLKKSGLRLIAAMHTDVSRFNLKLLKSKGITLCNVPNYSAEAIAELSFSILLNISRRTYEVLNFVRAGGWGFENFLCWELKGKTIGIIGMGAIGKKIAELALAFGMNILYYSRSRKPEMESKGIRFSGLEELLKKSDVISLNCPFNEGTKNILNKKRVSMLKKGAVVLNPGRNGLCDLEAVFGSASAGKIFAWFEDMEDPKLRKKFLNAKNIFLTPHYGWMTMEARQEIRDVTLENAKKFLEGKPINVIV